MKKVAVYGILIIVLFVLLSSIVVIFDSNKLVSDNNYSTINTQYSDSKVVGFAGMGVSIDTLLEIHSFDLNVVSGEGSVTIWNSNKEGYYFEGSYASAIHTWSNWRWLEQYWDDTKEIYTIDNDYNYVTNYTVIDDSTLMLGTGMNSERIIIDEIVETGNQDLFIIKAKRDCYGVENDQADLTYLATKFEKLVGLDTEECGEANYSSNGDIFYGYKERKIYF